MESIVEEALGLLREAFRGDAGRCRDDAPDRARRDLQIMDARWRDHLAEMDNLKDGIHLRWTVQADPLNAWQQEGYSMFGQLMEVIDNDYLRYILHVEAVQAPAAEPDLDKAVYAAAEDPVAETGSLAGALWPSRGPECPPDGRAQSGVVRERQWRRRRAKAQVTQPNAPDQRPGAHRQAAAREGRAQRPVLVRERQEVQVLPWRRLTAAGRGTPDFARRARGAGRAAGRGRGVPRAARS